MWKRERTEKVDLEDVMKSAPPTPVVVTPRPVEVHPQPVVATPVAPLVAAGSQKASVLGATLRFKGDLTADEDLVIEGHVEGSVLHTRSLTIGSTGCVKGNIRARRVVVEGKVDGNVYALESVVLRAGASLQGDLFARKVTIDTGARLSGRVDMDNAPAVPKIDTLNLGSSSGEERELSDREVGELLSGSSAA